MGLTPLASGPSGAYVPPMARSRSEFRFPLFGRERLEARRAVPRHRHRHGYITVVLAGSYQEAGFDGRRNPVAGQVVVHRAYDAHLDFIGASGTDLLNLPLPAGSSLPTAFAVDDADSIARMAELDPWRAAKLLRPVGEVEAESDWADLLATELVKSPACRLSDWACRAGMAPETVSRGFRTAYGITPARFRAEARARRAMAMIEQNDAGLAAIAADCGFADQPHLTRAIVELTGHPPGHWRRSNSFKNQGCVFA